MPETRQQEAITGGPHNMHLKHLAYPFLPIAREFKGQSF